MIAYWESSLLWEAIASWIVMETARIWFVYPARYYRMAIVSLLYLTLLIGAVRFDQPLLVWLYPVFAFGIYRRLPYALTVCLLQRLFAKGAATLLNGSVYYGFCLIPTVSKDWWKLCLAGGLWLAMLMALKWQDAPWLRHAMIIRIAYQGTRQWYLGYWDSGNAIRLDNKPVIQICDERFRDLSSSQSVYMMNRWQRVVPVVISGWRIPKQTVYAAYSEQMFFGSFEVLLNERMERVG